MWTHRRVALRPEILGNVDSWAVGRERLPHIYRFGSNRKTNGGLSTPDCASVLADTADSAREELHSLVERSYGERGEAIQAVAEEMKPCEYCSTHHYEECILHELLDRALTELSEEGELDGVLDQTSPDRFDQCERFEETGGLLFPRK